MAHLLEMPPESSEIEELERQIAKLTKINAALMQRVEKSMDQQANAYSLFQTAITLEGPGARAHRGAEERLVAARAHQRRAHDGARRRRARQPRSRRASSPPSATICCSRCMPRACPSARSPSPTGTPHQRRLAERIEHALTTIEELLEIDPRHFQARGRRHRRHRCARWCSTSCSPRSHSTSSPWRA